MVSARNGEVVGRLVLDDIVKAPSVLVGSAAKSSGAPRAGCSG